MKTNIGLTNEARKGEAQLLNALLSDEYVLYTKTRNFHWNVTGINFQEMHKMFEAQYDELAENVDEVAERIRALGEPAYGSFVEFLKDTRLKETPGATGNPRDMITALLTDHESIIRTLRTDLETCANTFKDVGTGDFLTGLMEKHEKTAWMLRSHLEG